MSDDPFLQRALALLDATPLVDGHNDMPYVIRANKQARGDVAAFALQERREDRDTDIPALREGRVSAQIWAAFVPPREARPASYALQQIALVRTMHRLHADVFTAAERASDIAIAKSAGRIASFIAIENGVAIENRLDALDAYYDLGVRLMTLCHNATIDWCDSATDEPRHDGLNDLGRDVIGRMNDLGMIVDLSHAAPRAAHQALDVARAPAVLSHSNAFALCDHPRNARDDLLDRIAETGGMAMATFVPNFIMRNALGSARKSGPDTPLAMRNDSPRPRGGTLAQFCDHLDYLRARMGDDHVGIGSDFFGGPQGEGLEDARCFPRIFAELMRRGWSDDALAKLASGNFIRLFGAVEAARSH